MRCLFVVMPWHSAHYPALSVGILKAIAEEYGDQVETKALYANLRWAEFLHEKTEKRIDLAEYQFLGEDLIFKGAGEWIFSSALHQEDEWKSDVYRAISGLSEENFELVFEAHSLARQFINDLAEEIASANFDLVGLTSTFMQNTPCLALAKRIKHIAPHIEIIMGGGNCDGKQGITIHQSFPFIDYVVSGEGENAFRRFIEYKMGSCRIHDIPSLVWRDSSGVTQVNFKSELAQMSEVPAPLYEEYFDQVLSSPLADRVELNIVIEGARGCWWGQKHHCTFCGLNGTGMAYRLKDGDTFVDELFDLVHRYQTLDIITADNIIGMDYFRSVLPTLKDRDYDLRIHYEVKANLRFDQLQLLKDAGVCHLQPGIESLTTKILKQMDKGTTGVQNVRVLRDSSELGLTATWNILVGFPDETFQDYQEVINQISALAHIQPPSSVGRIALQRFSPYFNKPELGFKSRKPASFYGVTYDLPDSTLENMVFLFEGEQRGVTEAQLEKLSALVKAWQKAYETGSLLTYEIVTDGIVIRDSRQGWKNYCYLVEAQLDVMILTETRNAKSRNALHALAQKKLGITSDKIVTETLKALRAKGLVFEEDDFFIALPTAQNANQIRVFGEVSGNNEPFQEAVA